MSKRILFLFVLLVMFAISCEEQNELQKQDQQLSPSDLPPVDLQGRSRTDDLAAQNATCGGSYNGTFTTPSQFHRYPAKIVDVSCAAVGSTITLYYDAVEIPNYFYIKNSSGSTIVSSGWRGYANYGGPWGMSLSTPTTGTLSITKTAGMNTIQLVVETVTPSTSYNPNTDAWSGSIGCTCAPPVCNPACGPGYTCVNGVCVCSIPCGGGFHGSYGTSSSFHQYPPRIVDITCAPVGSTIWLYYDAVEIPNYFYIKNSAGSTIISSGWRGYANYGGPWGMSLSTPTTGTLSFTKTSSAMTSVQLVVETVTPNSSYNPNTDAWSASVSCPN